MSATTDSPLSIDSVVATGRGDDGTTGVLFDSQRVRKDDVRTEAVGTIDEAVAAIGVARAELGMKGQYGVLPPGLAGLADLLLRLQRELFVVAADLATPAAARSKLKPGETKVTGTMVEGLESILVDMERHLEMPREFVVPGETRLSAAIEFARTVVRRAERRAVTLHRASDGVGTGDRVLPYLNRLADLMWVLARAAEQAESRVATPSRVARRQRRRPGSEAADPR